LKKTITSLVLIGIIATTAVVPASSFAAVRHIAATGSSVGLTIKIGYHRHYRHRVRRRRHTVVHAIVHAVRHI
jgi:hypothetical protein